MLSRNFSLAVVALFTAASLFISPSAEGQQKIRVFVTASTIDDSGFVSDANGDVADMVASVEKWLTKKKKLQRQVEIVGNPQDADAVVTLEERTFETIETGTSYATSYYDEDSDTVSTTYTDSSIPVTTIVGTVEVGTYSTEISGAVGMEFWTTAAKRFAFNLVDWIEQNHDRILEERR